VAALLVAALVVAVRSVGGPDEATAQAPRRGAAPPRTQAARAQKPSVSAVVNGEQITQPQLADECVRRYGIDVLESMLNKHLIWQECQRQKIVISAKDVEAEIQQMAGKFGLPVDRWLAMLESERDIEPNKYRRDIVWPTLALRRLAATQINVGTNEIRHAFESEYGPKVKVRLIAVYSQKLAEELRQKAVAEPNRFGDLAKEHSEDAGSAAARGLIPPIRKHVGHEELEKTAFGLKEGEISPIVKVANQYLILKCEGQVPESYVSSQHLEQIQDQMRDQIRDQKLRAAAGELFQRLQSTAEIVNAFANRELQRQMPGVAANINGQQITIKQLADECVVRHGKDVLEGEINRLMIMQGLTRSRLNVTNPMIDEEIARAAEAYGYIKPDGSPDIDAWLNSVTETDNVTVDLYVRDAVWPTVALKLLVQDEVDVTAEDLEKGFAANYGERVQVLTIVVGNQRLANKVWEMARNNPTDQFFGELASQYSIEPVSKANFGRIPPIRQHGGQPVIEEEAFRLQPGELSGIIAVADKHVILRCLGRTEPIVRDFSAVEQELRREIREKKLRLAMADRFDRLKEAAQIDNFLANSSQAGKPVDRKQSRPVASAGFQQQRR
jgi:parvulin-like peptidyl-prolyl isomerase